MFTDGRTQQATQLSGKDMRVVEKVGEGQLPSSTDADCNVRGALKTGQIGPDAASKIFKLITVTWLLGVVVGLVNFAAAVIVVVVVVVVVVVLCFLGFCLCSVPSTLKLFRMACSSQPTICWKSLISSQWLATA